jgi:OOP family OmpA-OmpF porin
MALSLVLSGCGKKKAKIQEDLTLEEVVDQESPVAFEQKRSNSDSIPTIEEETENFLDEEAISGLAFVNFDEDNLDADLLAKEDGESEKESDALLTDASDTENFFEDEQPSEYAFKTVHFDINKNSIRADQKPVVIDDCKVAQVVADKGKDVVVQGHTCQLGSASYNLALSQQRAESVKKEMIKSGVPAQRIKTVGYGYEMPVVWSDTQDKRTLVKELAPNRRAEILVN